jgi:hypothetical protein
VIQNIKLRPEDTLLPPAKEVGEFDESVQLKERLPENV